MSSKANIKEDVKKEKSPSPLEKQLERLSPEQVGEFVKSHKLFRNPVTNGHIKNFGQRFADLEEDILQTLAFFKAAKPSAYQMRFALQRVSSEILTPFFTKHKVHACFFQAVPFQDVQTKITLEEKAFYQGLIHCNSWWLCPVCNALISERRMLEIQDCVRQHQGVGGAVAMATFTIQHHFTSNAEAVHDDLCAAYRLMSKDHEYRREFRQAFGLLTIDKQAGAEDKRVLIDGGDDNTSIASFRTLEHTVGSHGHHWHYHMLYFLDSNKLALKAFERQLQGIWQRVCESLGVVTSRKYAVKVTWGNDAIAKYLTKIHAEREMLPLLADVPIKPPTWTESHELTKNASKSRSKGGYTARTLLMTYMRTRNPLARQFFLEYAGACYRKHPITASPGLKKFFGVVEKSDEEIGEERREEVLEVIALFNQQAWSRLRTKQLRGQWRDFFSENWKNLPACQQWLDDYGIPVEFSQGKVETNENETEF